MTDLLKSSYILLGTLKRDGSFVDTPVWFAPDGDDLYVFSNDQAGKVKRLRNFDDARIAPCTVTGKPLGEFQSARAYLLADPAAIKTAHRALIKRYGWQMRGLDLMARLGGRYNKRSFIRIRPSATD